MLKNIKGVSQRQTDNTMAKNKKQNGNLNVPVLSKKKQPNINCSTTSVTSGAGTADPSTATDYLLWFEWGLCCSIFSFFV
jgi:hypothetical protein